MVNTLYMIYTVYDCTLRVTESVASLSIIVIQNFGKNMIN